MTVTPRSRQDWENSARSRDLPMPEMPLTATKDPRLAKALSRQAPSRRNSTWRPRSELPSPAELSIPRPRLSCTSDARLDIASPVPAPPVAPFQRNSQGIYDGALPIASTAPHSWMSVCRLPGSLENQIWLCCESIWVIHRLFFFLSAALRQLLPLEKA
jgi:hypothetical protein